jgi:hypothetical protein
MRVGDGVVVERELGFCAGEDAMRQQLHRDCSLVKGADALVGP